MVRPPEKVRPPENCNGMEYPIISVYLVDFDV
jgi:hypothetical protein